MPAVELNAAILEENLRVLDEVDPELAARIRWPIDGSHVTFAVDGSARYRVHDRLVRLSLPRADPQRPPEASPSPPILLFGIGLGEDLEALIHRKPSARIVAWDRDPYLIRQALSRHRWGEALRSGALRLLMGVDLLEKLPVTPATLVIAHPVLVRVYQEELHLLRNGVGPRRAIVCSGGLFVDDLTEELRLRGFGVLPLHLTRLSREEILRSVRKVAPALVAAINYTSQLAELCAEAGCPLVCWEVDPEIRTMARIAVSTDQALVFTYRSKHVEEFRAVGFQRVEELPLAANPRRRRPMPLDADELERYGAKVSFVGSSMVREAAGFESRFVESYCAHRGSEARDEGRALLQEVLAIQRKDFSKDLITHLLLERLPDWPELDLAIRCAAEIASAEKRVVYVSSLHGFGVKVWGDDGWRIVGGASLDYRGPATHGEELNRIYGGTRINLDIGRLYQLDIVTMRIFDILACGGFVLAERSDDLARLFEIDKEIVCYSNLAELREKVTYFLAHPAAAHAITEAGREAVLRRHTVGHRVDVMLKRLGELSPRTSPPTPLPRRASRD